MLPDGGLWQKVALRKGSDAYVTADPDLFARILPTVFEFGPPQIAILAIVDGLNVAVGGLGQLIRNIVAQNTGAGGNAVCMDFDSGDLIRIV